MSGVFEPNPSPTKTQTTADISHVHKCTHVYMCIGGTISVATRSSPPARTRSLKEKTDNISTQLRLCRSSLMGDQLHEAPS